jgi:hypothetical protein
MAFFSLAQSKQEATHHNLPELIIKHRYPVDISDNGLVGEGADIILASGHKADIFMLGENHGVKQIAEISQILYRTLSRATPRVLVTEVGPATAYQTEQMIRQGEFESFLDEKTNLMSVPFFFLEQEVPLLYQATENFPEQHKQSIWGLDQEFLAGVPVVSKRLAKIAKTAQEKDAVDDLNWRNLTNPFLIAYSDGDGLLELQKAFANSTPEGQRITQQLIKSHEIYKANSDGRGRWSNETRESLMMENFEYYVDNYEGELPPMFFRFGAYHLHKGSSPTVEEALGLRIDNWAGEHQKKTVNVFVDAAKGQTVHPLLGTTIESPSNGTWEKAIFKDYLLDSQATLFDLRPLKGHPATKGMSNRIRHMLNGYDYLILFKSGDAQNYMPGTLVTYGYGIPIAILALCLLTLLVVGIVKAIKRLRSK